MSEQHRKLALSALSQMLGDDLVRAQYAFAKFTAEQMQEEHGRSGKTRQQVLDEYEAYDAKVRAAMAWVEQAQ